MEYVPRFTKQSRVPHAKLGLAMTALFILGLGLIASSSVDWFLLKRSLRNRFANLDWITTRELSDWLGDKSRQPPVLLDVRTPAEWNVSHLPDAQLVDPKASPDSIARTISKTGPIVTYCAVGYRSAEMAQRLRAAGFARVQNLEGSIFQWANEHRPLVRETAPVTRVHPYNAFWGRLLDDDVRAPLPRD